MRFQLVRQASVSQVPQPISCWTTLTMTFVTFMTVGEPDQAFVRVYLVRWVWVRLQSVWHLVVGTHLGLLTWGPGYSPGAAHQPASCVSALTLIPIPSLTLTLLPANVIFLKIIFIVPFLVGRGRRRSCNLIVDCKIIGARTTDVLPPCNLTGCLVLYQVPRVLLCGVLCPVLLVLVPPIQYQSQRAQAAAASFCCKIDLHRTINYGS